MHQVQGRLPQAEALQLEIVEAMRRVLGTSVPMAGRRFLSMFAADGDEDRFGVHTSAASMEAYEARSGRTLRR